MLNLPEERDSLRRIKHELELELIKIQLKLKHDKSNPILNSLREHKKEELKNIQLRLEDLSRKEVSQKSNKKVYSKFINVRKQESEKEKTKKRTHELGL